ncbi:MAG: NTP transferase domain-containing protein [Gammaproteobacteria bacterium]|nr:NTP transferase domain-containing protein [Gammaproteobacteria bacterium]
MPARVTGLWTVILSAGGSSRLGRPKQLLRRRGKTLLRSTAAIAQAVTPGRIVVVVGAYPFRMRAALRNCGTGIHTATNARWREGMAGSLRQGLGALPSNATAALILLTDQPLVTASDLERLIAAWARQPQRAAASRYAGHLGIPAILPRRFWRDAKRASGDVGAREILRRPGARITTVLMPTASVDIDTEQDLDALRHPAN